MSIASPKEWLLSVLLLLIHRQYREPAVRMASIGMPNRRIFATKRTRAPCTEGIKRWMRFGMRLTTVKSPEGEVLRMLVGYSKGMPPAALTQSRSGIAGQVFVPGFKQRSV